MILKKKMGSESISTSPISVDISLPEPLMEARIIDVCKDIFKKWSCLDNSRFSIDKVSGGITNLLVKVSVSEINGNDVSCVVRLYGPNTDLVIDRKRELEAIFHISSAGFGAELLGLFGNGMVQSFIDAKTLSLQEMSNPKIAAYIAKELHRFHQVEVPGSKEPQLWHDIFKFLEEAAELKYDDPEQQEKYDTISFEEIRNEISQLKELVDRLNAPVVFAHNDLLYGNLMLSNSGEKLYLISMNMQATNATIICEFLSYLYLVVSLQYNHKILSLARFPDKDAQYHFFRHYLQPDKPEGVTSEVLEALYVETNSYTLASHLYWALWALIQSKVSPIDFDYLEYFFQRYNEYKKQKEKRFSLAKCYLLGFGIS